MSLFFKMFLQKRFWIALVISTLLFQGLESFLELVFDIHLDHLLAFGGGVGFIVIYGLKFHILCCIIPTMMATLVCLRKGKHNCSDHHHSSEFGNNNDHFPKKDFDQFK